MSKKKDLMRMDKSRRVTIPQELRLAIGKTEKNWLLLSIKDGVIYLEICKPACLFCNSNDNLEKFGEKFICSACKEKISSGINGLKPLTPEEIGFSMDICKQGRIVIPDIICKALKINPGDFFDMSVEDNKIKLKHVLGGCSICGGAIDSDVDYLCKKCLQDIKNAQVKSNPA